MTKPYIITFKPVGRFFFGTSDSFGEGSHANSSFMPTQTTILGALRHSMLKNKNLLDDKLKYPNAKKRSEVESLTGKSSFIGLNEEETDLGKIKSISPVFIVNQPIGHTCPEDFLFNVPNDIFYNYEYENRKRIINGMKKINFKKLELKEGDKQVLTYNLDNKIKESHSDYFGGALFWEEYFNNMPLTYLPGYTGDKIFIKDSKPGIARKERIGIDTRYYIKNDFRLYNNFSFGVIVFLDDDNGLQKMEVFLGGERSLFFLDIKSIDEIGRSVFENHPIVKHFISGKNELACNEIDITENKLLFISPFITNDSLEQVSFAFIDSLYSPRSLGDSKMNSFNMIPAGSIIYSPSKIKNDNKYPIVTKIGYNWAIKY